MSAPTDRLYLPTHEWHLLEGDTVTIGITQFAADELTDITFVALPKINSSVTANTPFGEIESVKATSDLVSGVSGTVIAINDELTDNPGQVNHDPYSQGWMIKVRITNKAEYDKLLVRDEYLRQTGH